MLIHSASLKVVSCGHLLANEDTLISVMFSQPLRSSKTSNEHPFDKATTLLSVMVLQSQRLREMSC